MGDDTKYAPLTGSTAHSSFALRLGFNTDFRDSSIAPLWSWINNGRGKDGIFHYIAGVGCEYDGVSLMSMQHGVPRRHGLIPHASIEKPNIGRNGNTESTNVRYSKKNIHYGVLTGKLPELFGVERRASPSTLIPLLRHQIREYPSRSPKDVPIQVTDTPRLAHSPRKSAWLWCGIVWHRVPTMA